MGKSIKIILLLVLIALIAAGTYYYFNPKKALNIIIPELNDIQRIHVQLKGDTAYIDLELNISNKGLFKLHIDSLAYNIKLDTSTLLSKNQYINLQLSKGQKDSIKLPLALPFKRLMHKIKTLQGQDSVSVPIDVRIVYSTLFGKAVLPYSKTLRIEVPHPPKFEFEKLEFVKRHKKEFYLNAHVKMKNEGKIDLNVSELSYTMTVKGVFKASGHDPRTIHVKPGSVISESLPIKVEFKSLFKAAKLIVEKKDKVKYHLIIKGFIQNDKLGKDKTPIEIEKEDVMKLKK